MNLGPSLKNKKGGSSAEMTSPTSTPSMTPNPNTHDGISAQYRAVGGKLLDPDWKETREIWAKTSGMRLAIAKMQQHLELHGNLPLTVTLCLIVGPQEAVLQIQNTISGVALVAALFLVGNIAAATTPPGFETVDEESLGHTPFTEDDFAMNPYSCGLAYFFCNAIAVGSFMVVIAFYIRTIATTSRAAQRDSDIFMFFLGLSKDFNSQLNLKGFIALTVGLIMQGLGIIFASVGTRTLPLYLTFIANLLVIIIPCCLVFFTGDLKIGHNASSDVTDQMWSHASFLLQTIYAPRAQLDIEVAPPTKQKSPDLIGLVMPGGDRRQSS